MLQVLVYSQTEIKHRRRCCQCLGHGLHGERCGVSAKEKKGILINNFKLVYYGEIGICQQYFCCHSTRGVWTEYLACEILCSRWIPRPTLHNKKLCDLKRQTVRKIGNPPVNFRSRSPFLRDMRRLLR